jgi:hypothetical protein
VLVVNKASLVLAVAPIACIAFGCSPVSVTAEYADIEFSGTNGSLFTTFSTGDYHRSGFPVAKIYLTIGSAKPVFLPDLKVEDARQQFGEPEISQNIDGLEIQYYSIGEHSRIVFREGQVACCYAYADDKVAYSIAKTADGPFLKLPIKKRELTRVFGTPKGYTSSYGKGLRP